MSARGILQGANYELEISKSIKYRKYFKYFKIVDVGKCDSEIRSWIEMVKDVCQMVNKTLRNRKI